MPFSFNLTLNHSQGYTNASFESYHNCSPFIYFITQGVKIGVW